MLRLNVYRYGGPARPIGRLVIKGNKLSVTTDDPELARLVAKVNAAGFVHKWESIVETGVVGDRILPLRIAETTEFISWLERQLGQWWLGTPVGIGDRCGLQRRSLG